MPSASIELQQARDLCGLVSDALLVVSYGRVVDANPSACALVNATDRAAVIGRRIDTFLDLTLGSQNGAITNRQATTLSTLDGISIPVEVRARTLSGTPLIAYSLSAAAADSAETVLTQATEYAPHGVVVIDVDGHIALVNAKLERMFGYSRSQLLGAPLEVLLPEQLRAEHVAHRSAFHAAPRAREMGGGRDLMARRSDGSEFPVEIGLSPVTTAEKARVIATVIDISSRKAMEMQLQQSNASLEEFTYVASHDLKSPIHGIGELVGWIGEDLGETMSESVRRNLNRIDVRIKRVERMIEDLLAYARAGRHSAEQSSIDPSVLIDHTLELVSVPTGFSVTIACESKPFWGARIPLETALRNLISNALKHHDKSTGQLDISVHDDGSYCVLSVADDGPGIPAASRERIFKMFETVSASERGLSGVGLAVAKRMVESHGGRIALESTERARGAIFRIWWPRSSRSRSHE